MRHPLFTARTILVKNNDIDTAIGMLNKILTKEGVFSDYKRLQRYEKPWQKRKRVSYENCKAICNEEFNRKIAFLSRKMRTEAYPGCY